MKHRLWIFALLALLATPLAANDIVYLQGQIHMQDGSPPGRAVEVALACTGSEPVRQTNAGKNGKFFLKVERDEFNHIARALPATATDVGDSGTVAGSCGIVAKLEGYESSKIGLSNFIIGKDLKLPPLVLRPKTNGQKGGKK